MKSFIHDDEYIYTTSTPDVRILKKYGFKKYGNHYAYRPFYGSKQFNDAEHIIIDEDGMVTVMTTYMGIDSVAITLINLAKDGIIEIRRGDN